jgi:hypothetical protein
MAWPRRPIESSNQYWCLVILSFAFILAGLAEVHPRAMALPYTFIINAHTQSQVGMSK